VVVPESSVNEEDPEIDWVEIADKRAETSKERPGEAEEPVTGVVDLRPSV
jgi:hypothetical protein